MTVVTFLSHRPSRLSRALGISGARPDSVRRCRGSRYVVNWGVSTHSARFVQRSAEFSNNPESVLGAVNKLYALNTLHHAEVPCLEFTTDAQVADDWRREDGKFVARHVLNGHSGAGIQIVRTGEEVPTAPLYTRYFKKQKEYRAHVAFGNVILIQEKRRNARFDESDPLHKLVRTNGNGWTFCVNDLSCDRYGYRQHLVDLATSAVRALGLGHGAVDILVATERTGTLRTAVVCEVNTAPAVRNPSTLRAYVAVFRTKIDEVTARQL